MAKFNLADLEKKTVAELREMARNLGITGVAKKAKAFIIEKILGSTGGDKGKPAKEEAPASVSGSVKAVAPVTQAEFFMQSTLTKPTAKFGDKTTTTIRVSSGAATGNFSVSGRSVAAVSEFLREVLNIDKMADGLVNGKPVGPEYILREGDNLEFIKPAGRKG